MFVTLYDKDRQLTVNVVAGLLVCI